MPRTPGILIAAHDRIECSVIEAAVGEWNLDHKVAFVHDFEGALRHLEASRRSRQEPDLLIVDQELPTAGGVALVDRVRAMPSLVSMPVVVVCSALACREALAACLHARASTVLRKPADRHDYQQLLCTVLDYWLILDEGGKGTGRKGTNPVTLSDGGCA